MICVSVYNNTADLSSEDYYIPSIDFHFDSIEELEDLLDICLAQGKCVVISLEKKTE